ncbi:MAG: hypothetical protein L3J56_01005 [Bacteroidales bacterium]|nr:hypothetical protein [Bacteroidales bacterium]
MKKGILIITVFALLFSSAGCIEQKTLIGDLNMVSNRNIDINSEYVLIKRNYGLDNKAMRKSKALTIEDAIDQTVNSVPDGEFIMNVQIWQLRKGNDKNYFYVSGDVWGKK